MVKAKILIVEDEPIVALDIKSALIKLGFEVTGIATSYEEILISIKSNEPEIILMDINLGNGLDGIEIVQKIKKINDIPVIYLTAFSDEKTMQRAFHTDPIGYIIKPFKREELKSTILLCLYKIKQTKQINIDTNCEHIGCDYYFNLKYDNLYYKNKLIKLSDKERQLLSILVNANGATISFEQIEFQLWSEDTVSPSALRTLIYRLKVKVGCKLIKTIQAFGYKLAPDC